MEQFKESQANVDEKVRNALKSRQDQPHEEAANRNFSKYVTPYTVNPYQRNMLSHILGKDNISAIEEFNALVYSGLVNVNCPPIDKPELTEKYHDPLTGRAQCRKPTRDTSSHRCPTESSDPLEQGDPFKIEPYTDAFGKFRCRKPVRSGHFQCPPPNVYDPQFGKIMDNSMKTEHITMPDGTGICIDKNEQSKYSMMPTSVIGTSDKVKNFISQIESMGLDQIKLKTLAQALKAPGLIDMKDALLSDPQYSAFNNVLRNIYTDDDQHSANIALFQYMGGSTGGAKAHRKTKRRSKQKRSAHSKRKRHTKRKIH